MVFRVQWSHNNARTQEGLSVKNTQTSDTESRTCVRYLKRFKMHMSVLSFSRKTYASNRCSYKKIRTRAKKENYSSGSAGDEKSLHLGAQKLIFFNRFSRDIHFSSLVSFAFFGFLFFLWLFVSFLKLKIYILIHIQAGDNKIDNKIFT